MMPQNLILRMHKSFAWLGIEAFAFTDDYKAVAVSMTMDKYQPGSRIEPLFTLDKQAAQILMDDLWNAGIRPTEGSGSAGSLAATQVHLGDMRKIVAAKLGIVL